MRPRTICSNGLEAKTPGSTILPIYDVDIAGTTRKAIIRVDSGTSTLNISQRIVNELGLRTTKIKARRVKIADHSRCTVDRIATADVKVGNLPTETLTAYVFPLEEDDEGYESSNKHGMNTKMSTTMNIATVNPRPTTL
jgi:Aspartyl protease